MVKADLMRRNKTLTLREALEELIREYGLGSRLRDASVINTWNEIAGKAISSRTKKIYLKNGELHIYLTSAVVRNELMMLKEDIRQRINAKAGADAVRQIVLH